MVRKCQYPKKPCSDRYCSGDRRVLKCRLDEWKTKVGVCPYNTAIRSKNKAEHKAVRDKKQTRLI